MSEIHGLGVHAAGAQLLPYKYDPGALGANEVEIKISHCGICFSDIHLIDNDWGISKYPFIPGHEIVGTVVAVGSGVKDRTMGERVGVGWQAGSCGICEWCRQGDEHLCAKSQPTCVGRNGGFAEKIRVNSKFAIPVPQALESENAAPLMCGGLRSCAARPRWWWPTSSARANGGTISGKNMLSGGGVGTGGCHLTRGAAARTC